MTEEARLVGSWRLVRWTAEIEGREPRAPFGADAQGSLVYGAAGWMTAILMRPGRRSFERPMLALGSPAEKREAVEGYVSYAGTWELHGARVVHHVELSLLPNWIGTELVREVAWQDEHLVLTTLPERTAHSGRIVTQRLEWRRVDTVTSG